jgi:hypothetical protein
MTNLWPFTINTDLCIVCQEEGKKIVAEGNGFHHSWNYWLSIMLYEKYNKKEKFCDRCFNKVEWGLAI